MKPTNSAPAPTLKFGQITFKTPGAVSHKINTMETFGLDGKKYKSVEKRGCKGCAFEYSDDSCSESSFCSGLFREDNKDVIFVEVKEDKIAKP